jgi:hypothetical protein
MRYKNFVVSLVFLFDFFDEHALNINHFPDNVKEKVQYGALQTDSSISHQYYQSLTTEKPPKKPILASFVYHRFIFGILGSPEHGGHVSSPKKYFLAHDYCNYCHDCRVDNKLAGYSEISA